MRPSPFDALRQALAALIVGLMMLVSAAPCAAFAASQPGRPVITAPADPCKARHTAVPCACAQLSCQHAVLGSALTARAPTPSQARFSLASDAAHGRDDAPPLPPPRLL